MLSHTSDSLFRLDGQRAVVTGASRGIGRALALGLAAAGADVVCVARSPLDDAGRQHFADLGRRVECIQADLGSRRELFDLVLPQVRAGGPTDILVHAAGINRRGPAEHYDEGDWDEVLEVNLTSTFLLCRELGRDMLANQRGGRVILIGSLLSFQGGWHATAYAASKGGVAQLTRSLANEWAARGVNVNAIAPGYVETQMTQALAEDPTRQEEISRRIPAGRWATPQDLVGAAVFLASPASAYVHGTVLPVDGGWLGR